MINIPTTFYPLLWSIMLYDTVYLPPTIIPFTSNILINTIDLPVMNGQLNYTGESIHMSVISNENTTISIGDTNLLVASTNGNDTMNLVWPRNLCDKYGLSYKKCTIWNKQPTGTWTKVCSTPSYIIVPEINISVSETNGLPISYSLNLDDYRKTFIFNITFVNAEAI